MKSWTADKFEHRDLAGTFSLCRLGIDKGEDRHKRKSSFGVADIEMTNIGQIDSAARVRAWLGGKALPFWLQNGSDRAFGGFVEQFTLQGVADDPGYKRCRVTARQLYVFSHAAILGTAEALPIAAAGYRFLIDKFHLGEGRWARRVSRSGEVIDATADLYDIAFVLFALGWWFRASGDRAAIDMARQTILTMRLDLRHPSGEGYLHDASGTPPYQQNPHMHLLEAMLVLSEQSKGEFFKDEADRLYRLARDRFIAGTGTLAEFFESDWRRPGTGVRIEPGHHFEWTWLMKRYRDIGGPREAEDMAGALFDFAVDRGVEESTGLAWDAILPDGAVVEADHRIWAQLEAIKAWIAMEEIRKIDARPAVARLTAAVFDHYLDPAYPGLWIDHVTRSLEPRVKFAPTSTLYHVFLSFSELLRAYPGV